MYAKWKSFVFKACTLYSIAHIFEVKIGASSRKNMDETLRVFARENEIPCGVLKITFELVGWIPMRASKIESLCVRDGVYVCISVSRVGVLVCVRVPFVSLCEQNVCCPPNAFQNFVCAYSIHFICVHTRELSYGFFSSLSLSRLLLLFSSRCYCCVRLNGLLLSVFLFIDDLVLVHAFCPSVLGSLFFMVGTFSELKGNSAISARQAQC